MKTMERLRPEIVNEGQSKGAGRRRLLHRIFELGAIAKRIDGALERVGGVLPLFVSPVAITGANLLLVRGEMKEDPNQFGSELARACHWNDLQEQSSYKGFLILQGTVAGAGRRTGHQQA
jgi:uncharacterized membrane protein